MNYTHKIFFKPFEMYTLFIEEPLGREKMKQVAQTISSFK